METNKSTVLLVFAPVFSVAPNVTYSNTLCLARLDGQPKSGAVLADLFVSMGLKCPARACFRSALQRIDAERAAGTLPGSDSHHA